MEINRKLVEEYWDKQPAESTGIGFPEGSLEFFEEMEERRYGDKAFIHSLTQFTRWRGNTVLEVGCGCGTDLLQFARAGAEIYAIDLSRHSVELTKKRLEVYKLHAEVIYGDGEALPFPSDYFDLVYCWGVLHHTPNPSRMVDEIYRVLKPGHLIKGMVHHHNSPIWLKTWFQYAFLKGRIFTSLSRVISEHQESPGTRAFTMKQIKNLFQPFSNLKFEPIPICEIGFLKKHRALSWLANFYPRCFAAWIAVEAVKR